MIKVLYSIFRDYGLDAAQLFVIVGLGWKIMSNHLKHIQDSIDKLIEKTEKLENAINSDQQRISNIEGQLK